MNEIPFPCPKCGIGETWKDKQRNELRCDTCDWHGIFPDHPHTDPGDGRTQCPVCGKWVWLVTHSCKGVRVAPPQLHVVEGDQSTQETDHAITRRQP